jgi:CBS domain-containing protein
MDLRQHLRTDPITELRLRPLVTAYPHTPMGQAVAAMRKHGVRSVIVLEQSTQKPIGIFNERMLIKALAAVDHAMSKPIGEFIIRSVPLIRRDEPIAHLVRLMKRQQVRSACVTDENGKPVALAGVRGLLEYLSDFFPYEIKVQPFESQFGLSEREGA